MYMEDKKTVHRRATKRHKWTDEEIDLIYSGKYFAKEIAEMTGRSRTSVVSKCNALGISARRKLLYSLCDLKTDETIFVGTKEEMCEFTGKSRNAIDSAICHAKKRGTRCHFAIVGYDCDDEEY